GGLARPGATTRFDRALAGARELAASLGAGDAVAIVTAGAPARVALAATTNRAAVASALEALEPSDRATDLDGAIRASRELLKGLVHADKRIVLLSDLADGHPSAAPIASDGGPVIWAPLPELEASGADCAGATPTCAGIGSFAGRCVQCEPAMSAACTGATPVCDGTTDICRGCVANSDCGGGTPLCDLTAHVCRACTNADCTGSTPVCEATGTNTGRCVACDATHTGACTAASVCDTATNTCVGCRTAADCSGATPLCDAVSHLCRSCAATDCGGATPVCATMGAFNGGCVQCEPGMSAACTGATAVCNAATDRCVGCATGADCSGGTPVCDPTAHTCRACVAADCTGTTPVCVASGTFAGNCEQCAAGSTAACTGATPTCDTVIDRCVLCVPGPTGDASACATQTSGHACVAAATTTDPAFCGCVADSDCGGATSGRICEATTHLCIDGCWSGTGHNGCPVTEVCNSTSATVPGHCGAVCITDAECPAAHPHCLPVTGAPSVCVDCVADTNCASRTDGRTRCIGADHTCAQCTATDVASCDPGAIGGSCLGTGLCGCSGDGDCSASRRCDTAMHACVVRTGTDGGTDGGTDASTDASTDGGRVDSGVTDGSIRDGGLDAGSGLISGNGACACRAAGTQTPSRGPVAVMLLGLAAVVARRRRRLAR
ncbi:MAG: VWA domain-containing protein, partial [Deltaproteobacteria bacterium]